MKFIENNGDGAYKVSQINNHLKAMEDDFYYLPQLVGADGKPINLDKGALELLKRYFSGEEILFRNDYFATKLWSREDIEDEMVKMGYNVTDEAVDEVIKAGEAWNGLTDCDDSEYDCIDAMIEDTLGDPDSNDDPDENDGNPDEWDSGYKYSKLMPMNARPYGLKTRF